MGAPVDLGTAVIGIPEGSDLELDLRLEAVMEGVLVTGAIRGQAVGECVRCLDEVTEPVDVTMSELFVYPGDQHLFADASLDAYDEKAATLLRERVRAFLASL